MTVSCGGVSASCAEGFSAPISPPAGDYVAVDGDILFLIGPATVTMPPASTSAIGVKMAALAGTGTITRIADPSTSDTIADDTIIAGQSVSSYPYDGDKWGTM